MVHPDFIHKIQMQGLTISPEGIQRVVQEVEGRETQLDFAVLVLPNPEVLVNRQIVVLEIGPMDIGNNEVPILTFVWRRKTVPVDVLAGFQIRGRVAGHEREKGYGIRSGNLGLSDADLLERIVVRGIGPKVSCG